MPDTVSGRMTAGLHRRSTMTPPTLEDVRIAVIGLGYVGLPLAAYMAQHFPVVGFDIDAGRIAELQAGHDRTLEVTDEEFSAARHLSFSSNRDDLRDANIYIVTVPTPIDASNRPDLTALEKASETVGRVLSAGNVVVYESTVYPGATEEVCVPIVERLSGLAFNVDFFAGYSPERINPGDKQHRLPHILKITSGSTTEAADLIDRMYGRVITAGTHRASSIRVAEAAKVIENIQRDVNIALVNELAQLFKRLGLDTKEVLEAAGTKWNFHGYRPGLVGGHCIGVDPYYLTHKAQAIGFHPEMILAGRRINDGMSQWVARDVISVMLRKKIAVGQARILVMGFTFKENVPDIRNTKVADLVTELAEFAGEVVIFDPHADPVEVRHEYGLEVCASLPDGPFDGLVLAVGHDAIRSIDRPSLDGLLRSGSPSFIYDVKWLLPAGAADGRL
jgi:UDP-N-acetyl-D-galactosamine dehydrogenase